MKDQFRSRRVALWLNLIPDLVRSGEMEAQVRDSLSLSIVLKRKAKSIDSAEIVAFRSEVFLFPLLQLCWLPLLYMIILLT